MLYRVLRSITCVLFSFVFLMLGSFTVSLFAAEIDSNLSDEIIPLPPGCIDGTPVGEETPACCISGFVYINSELALGADVTIQSQHGEVTVQTAQQLDTESRPYYRQSLSTEPLKVKVGDIITVTARYSGYTRTLTHTVQAEGQQVDIALAPDSLSFASENQGNALDDKFNSPISVATDSEGRIYVTDSKNFRVLVFNPNGSWVAKWGGMLGNLPTQFGRPLGVAIDQRTNIVYVVDRDNNRILKYSAAGDLFGVLDNAKISSSALWLGAPKDVAVDGAGNVYILSRSGITKFNDSGEYVSHWGAYSDGSTDRADLDYLAVSPQGEVFVPDRTNHIIHRFDLNGQPHPFTIQTITATAVLSSPLGITIDTQNRIFVYEQTLRQVLMANMDGTLLDALPRNPVTSTDQFPNSVGGISLHGDTLYVVGTDKNRILRLSLTRGDFITPSIGSQDTNPYQIEKPRGLAIDSLDQLFFTDIESRRLGMMVADEITRSWSASDLGLTVWSPIDVVVDSKHKLWVIDNGQEGLLRFDLNGLQLTKNGQWKTVDANPSALCKPTAMDIDAHDNLFVLNSCNQTLYVLRLVNDSLQMITSYTGTAESGLFSTPTGLTINNKDGAVYVADTVNNRIVHLHFTGTSLEFVKSWGEAGSGPGQFAQPWDVVISQDDYLYVSDHGNHSIQKFDAAGVWQTSFGSIGVAPGDWLSPTGLAIDSLGNLYAADEGLGRIQRLAQVTNTAPIATIVHYSATDLRTTDLFTATGMGQDSDATNIISEYEWSSNRQGVLQSGSNPILKISASQLISGSHILRLRVKDDEGSWSIPVQIRLYVVPVLPPDPCQSEHWTMLLYLDGDYQDGGKLQVMYEEAIAKLKGVNNACVRIAVQLDGAASIGSTINDTQRFGIETGKLTVVESVDEQAMDDASTLAEFVVWGQQLYPADHYYMAIADHGQGILGIGWDHTTDYRSHPPSIDNDKYLTVQEIVTALDDVRIADIDILHLDACSMGLLDAAYELRYSTRYLIASQYLGWSLFAYADYASLIPQITGIVPAKLASAVVNRYADLAAIHQLPYTLSALDVSQVGRIKNAVDSLAVLLRGWVDVDLSPSHERAQLLSTLRNGSQLFNSDGDLVNTPTDLYVDLLDWAIRIESEAQIDDPAIKRAANQLVALLQLTTNPFVIANRAESNVLYSKGQFIDLSRAHGISIYLPPYAQPQFSEEYAAYLEGELYGLTVASRWDSFLQTALGAPEAGDSLAAAPSPLGPEIVPERVFLPLIQR